MFFSIIASKYHFILQSTTYYIYPSLCASLLHGLQPTELSRTASNPLPCSPYQSLHSNTTTVLNHSIYLPPSPLSTLLPLHATESESACYLSNLIPIFTCPSPKQSYNYPTYNQSLYTTSTNPPATHTSPPYPQPYHTLFFDHRPQPQALTSLVPSPPTSTFDHYHPAL